MNAKQIEELIEAGFFSKQEKAWLKMYHKLKILQETIGHCRVPPHEEKNPKLSSWLQRRRDKLKATEKPTPVSEEIELTPQLPRTGFKAKNPQQIIYSSFEFGTMIKDLYLDSDRINQSRAFKEVLK
ncbi:helicase associated domain-containing protein [Rubellicoccus peritrichatus]|uniref:Helicase associated domain-containing protein n=1 Tax=Rubellicoccus peritrichatus TaxID=3080537 RepID=A0AAQ3L5P6_9BACT|nr:helicase associated domain-containing protein [Puniceicoccus sp. CR14]WOO39351.1 helicase associated domain-containing protein [Puniceicoccus sp. CR14]